MTINQRIKQRLKELTLAEAELARRVGLTTTAVQYWVSDGPKKATPRRHRMALIAKALETTEQWLEFGDAAPTKAAEPHAQYVAPNKIPALSKEAVEIAVAFDRLSAVERAYHKAAILRDLALAQKAREMALETAEK